MIRTEYTLLAEYRDRPPREILNRKGRPWAREEMAAQSGEKYVTAGAGLQTLSIIVRRFAPDGRCYDLQRKWIYTASA